VTKGRLKRPVSLPNIGRIASLEAATLRGTQVGVGQQVQLLMRFEPIRIRGGVQARGSLLGLAWRVAFITAEVIAGRRRAG
jgi:hypothetical protein